MKIKFVTLNLFEGGLFFDNIKDFLKKLQPDIAVFQEVYDGKANNLPHNFRSVEELKKIMPNYYDFKSLLNHQTKYGGIEHGNLIFSKYPITKSKITFFDIGYDSCYVKEDRKDDYSYDPEGVQYAKIKINSTFINVFNIHGIWGFDGKDNPRRINMSKIILKVIGKKENTILAGDFNVRPDTQTIGLIEKRLKNVFKDELVTTFNMSHKDDLGYATSVVDMVFVDNNIKILDHYCPQVDISDHLPLVCVFEID